MKRFLLGLAALALITVPACICGDTCDDMSCCEAATAEGRECDECADMNAEMKQCCKDAAALGKECAECAAKE